MATYYLINCVSIGAAKRFAGELVDDRFADVAAIRSSGGVLVPSSNAARAIAASLAQNAKRNGANEQELNAIMSAALDGNSNSAASTIPFVNPVVVNQPLALTTATGSGQLDIRYARSGHVPGSVLGVLVPGGRFSGASVPGSSAGESPAPRGDIINSAIDQTYFFEVTPGGVIVPSIVTSTADAAPVLISATANGSQITTAWSKRVHLASLLGFSLSYTSGTPRTLTDIASGNDSASVVLNCSGAIGNTDVLSIAAAAQNDITAMSGAPLAAVTMSVATVTSVDVRSASRGGHNVRRDRDKRS